MSKTIFLGCPTHNGQLHYRMAKSFFVMATKEHALQFQIHQTSLLASGCNRLWTKALNDRVKNNLSWFAMLHADVAPEPWWLDKLIAIAEQHDADLLSAVVPIKDSSGVTSTAIGMIDNNWSRFTRLTQKQLWHEKFPETFDVDMACKALADLPEGLSMDAPITKLLVNTGCMICRLDRPWSSDVYFTINDRIQRQFGEYYPEVEPEDWFFSRIVAEAGGKVMATRAVKVEHHGSAGYLSENIWGSEVDPSNLSA